MILEENCKKFNALVAMLLTVSLCNGLINASEELLWNDMKYDVARSLDTNEDFYNGTYETGVVHNCSLSNLMSLTYNYNDTCIYIRTQCHIKTKLINYLSFALCNLSHYKPLTYVILVLWLMYLIALLAATVDNFLVSPLTILSDKLRLSPSTAGSTLMAFANGAPDIFVVYCGISQDDFAFVLGAMSGGAIFMISITVGCVILVSKTGTGNIKRADFIRDVIAYLVATCVIVIVAYDGKVYLSEAIVFLVFYCIYVSFILGIGYFKQWHQGRKNLLPLNPTAQMHWHKDASEFSTTLERSLPLRHLARTIAEGRAETDNGQSNFNMAGLTWPKHGHVLLKSLWIIQWPVMLLMWLTIPSCCRANQWSKWHYTLTSFTPVPMGFLILTMIFGWNGYRLYVGRMPVVLIIIFLGLVITAVLLIVLSPKKTPKCFAHFLLVIASFSVTVVWLDIIANEIVSLLQAFGIIFNVNTALIGLTVLAVGNSVADWIADLIITRAGKPEMALACCFSSPLIGDVLGLSISLIVKLAAFNHGTPIHFSIQNPEFTQVKVAWIFLGIAFLVNLLGFPIFKFNPPRLFSICLFAVYTIFVIFLLLSTLHVLKFN